MASGIDKKLTTHLECAVCLERFRDPKVLSCQHSYCRECLEELVTRNLRGNGIAGIKCPECRKQTMIPGGDVKNLQSNFLINKLLSDLDIHSDRNLFCKKHDDEKLKLFCQTCDVLICRDCILIDHRDHTYKFVKDIYPAEKKKIEKAVKESRAKIADLEATIEHLDVLECKAQANCREVSNEIDAFIAEQFVILEKKRKSLKIELKNLAGIQRKRRQNLKESLNNTLACVKKDVELAEQTMKSGDVAKLLAAKKKIMTTLTNKVSVPISTSKKRFLISHFLEVNTPLNEEVFKNMANIRKRLEACGTDEGDDGDYYDNPAAPFGDPDGDNHDDYAASEVSDLDADDSLIPDQWDDVPACGVVGGDNHDDYAASEVSDLDGDDYNNNYDDADDSLSPVQWNDAPAFGSVDGDDYNNYDDADDSLIPDQWDDVPAFGVVGGDNHDDYAASGVSDLDGGNRDDYVVAAAFNVDHVARLWF